MGFAQIVGHLSIIVEVRNSGWKVRFTSQQDIFGTAGQVGFVFFGQGWDWEGVPAELV